MREDTTAEVRRVRSRPHRKNQQQLAALVETAVSLSMASLTIGAAAWLGVLPLTAGPYSNGQAFPRFLK
jgi:hypothetical protein